MTRTIVRHYSWTWDELPSAADAAWREEWVFSDDGALIERRRTPLAKNPAHPTISTDPRAGAIMREELGLKARSRPMGGPHA